MNIRLPIAMTLAALSLVGATHADDFAFTLRTVRPSEKRSRRLEHATRPDTWKPAETAVIVCDTWDLHHCLNAVRRLEEFAPRLNDLLVEARKRGATIIHAPSDCMPAYEGHPARVRAETAPQASDRPQDVEHWCSQIATEGAPAWYPIDQSDGGEDDDPAEHAEWAAKLKALGRNPGTPWKSQSSLIAIDGDHDYISDRGDEVYNILKSRGIRNVLLTGVHTNMCVLGRPFGLRQMVRNGFNTALVRDLTDSMYNPKRWPYVDHFTGHDLVIAYVERYVCPTITSDQILGGKPFKWSGDLRDSFDILDSPPKPRRDQATYRNQWNLIDLPSTWNAATNGVYNEYAGVAWYRCAVKAPAAWAGAGLTLDLKHPPQTSIAAWCNGAEIVLQSDKSGVSVGAIPLESLAINDANLLVVRLEHKTGDSGWATPPRLSGKDSKLTLKGYWQFRLGDDPTWSNIPLPAKFGISPDVFFEPNAK